MRSLLPILLPLVALSGCDGCGDKPKPAVAVAADAAQGAAKVASTLTTTNEEIYLSNLEGQIRELERLAKESEANASLIQRLSAARYTRARFKNDPDEIQQAIDDASTCVKMEPESAICLVMRAEQEQSLHRFQESRRDLEKARQIGGDPTRIADLQNELDWNDGQYEKTIAAIRKARAERPSTGTWIREAQLEHDLGNDDASDAAFDKAEAAVSDTSPLPVAHLELQRGIQNVARGKLEGAIVYFRRAVLRMPSFVAANEHLAETLHWLGKNDEATVIYEKIVTLSNDPEFAYALCELYRAVGKDAEARALEAKARNGYEQLLAKYPEAMYWHASEFYRAVGDEKKSLDLLRRNLLLRPNSMSWVALARAELLNKNTDAARNAIDKALAMPVVSASLFWTAQAVYRRLGDAAKADGFRDRAKKLNPRIALIEGSE